ncbi:MAG: type II toxin-antitoxin system Phd/YefM family antitoxin [Phenylobacterium sp.]|uniref:type II toxin-antitoxin system Phd/YefM family antitoxin n=1 Tax=unclassified Phenylobacterium TaxID=2640670 RepID=UPI000AAC160E|nr:MULTISPECIES: type II toxin-antitoxin system Phd/YefM family antitoxin [unclassified Phenylobacterium]MBA4794421.1 type II toxin-antitoxin system Phd/YefM family antitoxin [Phenylobacterium sp.]
MPVTASAGEVENNFAAFHDLALSAPVRVTREGRETVYIVSAETFHWLKQSERAAPASEDLSEAEVAANTAAEIPPEHRYSLKGSD